MKFFGIIPARYKSTRFPGKPLAKICGKPMIQWVYEKTCKSSLIDSVYVATDDKRIFEAVEDFGGRPLMTATTHSCGTERLAECVDLLALAQDDVVINIQGDEPLISEEAIKDLINIFKDNDVYMGTLKKEIEDKQELNNPNVVKVITDLNDNALYFSRYCIPYNRDNNSIKYFKHIGVYGYKVCFLKKYVQMEKSFLEKAESLEQLRVLEHGYKIRVAETKYQTIGVDTEEQLRMVEKIMLGERNE